MSHEHVCKQPLSEAEVAAIADGELSLVRAEAVAHAEQCDGCSSRVADSALSALELRGGLVALAAKAATAPQVEVARAQPSPTKPLLVAVALVLLSTLPLLPSLARSLSVLLASGRVYREAVWQALEAVSGLFSGPVWSLSAALALVLIAVVLARGVRNEQSSLERQPV